jgi:hypothetical protein
MYFPELSVQTVILVAYVFVHMKVTLGIITSHLPHARFASVFKNYLSEENSKALSVDTLNSAGICYYTKGQMAIAIAAAQGLLGLDFSTAFAIGFSLYAFGLNLYFRQPNLVCRVYMIGAVGLLIEYYYIMVFDAAKP